MAQKVDNFLLTRGETTHSATECLAECASEDVDFAIEVELLCHTVTGRANHTSRVAFVNHHHSVVFFCEFANLVHWSHVAVHREHAIGGDDAEALCLCFLQALFKFFHVGVGVAIAFCLAEAHTVDDRSVVQRVADDSVAFAQQRFKQSAVGIEAA